MTKPGSPVDPVSRPADPASQRLLSGEAWRSLCQTLERAERFVLADDAPSSARDRAEGFRYLTRFLAAGIVSCVSHADPDYPLFGRMIDYAMPWGLDNPDCLYLISAIGGDAQYRVFGNRGSANHLDIQVNFGHFANGDISSWGTISSLDGFDLETAADGSFELQLGGERRPGPGNWLELADNAEFILVRQYFDDWENERPADLWIERVGAEYPLPPLGSESIAGRIDKLCRWLDKGATLWDQMSRGLLSMEPNSLLVHLPGPSSQRAGMAGQAYGMGNFRCAPNEAVVIDFVPPPCHHWSVSLANFFWESIEYASRQTSVNGHQAQLDSDGHFRAVIAHEDPGVANWLDPAGHQAGTLAARFLRAEAAPEPELRRIPLARLDDELPSDTARMTTDERRHALERRYRAVVRRFRC